jgi:hypothetical protein
MLFHATGQNRFDQTFSSLWENLPNYNGSSLHPSSAASGKASRGVSLNNRKPHFSE